RRCLSHRTRGTRSLWRRTRREARNPLPQQGGCAHRGGARGKTGGPAGCKRRQGSRDFRRLRRRREGRLAPCRRCDRRAARRGEDRNDGRGRGLAPMSTHLENAQRVVVKIGSALLTDDETGKLNRSWLQALVEDVARMRARGQEMMIVSSGAIALGRRALKLAPGKLTLEAGQAAAAVGQIGLAHAFQ